MEERKVKEGERERRKKRERKKRDEKEKREGEREGKGKVGEESRTKTVRRRVGELILSSDICPLTDSVLIHS